MSMMTCTRCDQLIDSDGFPEFFREELKDEFVCDRCVTDAMSERICVWCNGTGEGRVDGSRCGFCKGRGSATEGER